MDNYVAPKNGGFVSVVNDVEQWFATQSEAERNYNTRRGQDNTGSPGVVTDDAILEQVNGLGMPQIFGWVKSFAKQNGRLPTKEEIDAGASSWSGSSSYTPGAASGGATGTTSMDTSGMEYINTQAEALKQQALQDWMTWLSKQQNLNLIDLPTLQLNYLNSVADNAYKERMLQLVQIPETQIKKDQLALDAANSAVNQAMSALEMTANLRGPRNAFQQQSLLHGLNASGISTAVDAVMGKYNLNKSGAPNAAPEAATIQTMIEDMKAAGGGTGVQNPAVARILAMGGYNTQGTTGTSMSGLDPSMWDTLPTADSVNNQVESMPYNPGGKQATVSPWGNTGQATGTNLPQYPDYAAALGWLSKYQPDYASLLNPSVQQPGAGASGTDDSAYLDYIWSKRPDLAGHYSGSGWDVSTPDTQRKAVQDWLKYPDNAGWGGSASTAAKALGWTGA